jgi:diguanylate cyclase (GGDEF)-like protein
LDRQPRHDHATTAHQAILLGEKTDGLLKRLRELREQIAAARSDALDVRRSQHLISAALRAEVIAEAAVLKLDELSRLSQHDPLTGLPNRTLILDRIENAIALAHRHGAMFAVLFVDLDDFKNINDALGHHFGDRALQLAARRLLHAIRASDTVGRYGGDEFLILLSEISQVADAAAIASKLLTALSGSSEVNGQTIELAASIGIAVYPLDGEDVDTLIARADSAMYRAKKQGPNGIEFYADHGRASPKIARAASAVPSNSPVE